MAKRKSAASSGAQKPTETAAAPVIAARNPLQGEDKGFTMNRFLARQQEVTGKRPVPERPAETAEVKPKGFAEALAETAPNPDRGKLGDGETPSKPKTLKALAELAKLEVKDLYDLEIPLEAVNGEPVGKTVTLGQLKDAHGGESDLEARAAAFEEAKTKGENELLRARQQLQEIVASLPRGAVKPELIAKMNAETEAYRRAETERLAEAIPEWGDDARYASDRAAILEHLAEYGYGEQAFDGIIDHRMKKYVRDSALRWRRMNEALAKVTEVKPKSPAGASKPAAAKPKGKAPIPASGQNLSPMQLRARFGVNG